MRENDQPTAPTENSRTQEIAPGKGLGSKKFTSFLQSKQRFTTGRGGGEEGAQSWTARAGICSWSLEVDWTTRRLASTGRSEERKRHDRTRQFLPVFLLLFAGKPPTGHDSVDSQAGCRRVLPIRFRSIPPSHSQRPSPRADPDFFTGARACACAAAVARVVGNATGAAGLGRRRTRPA